MTDMKDLLQKADWKAEKHVPVIELLAKPTKTENVKIAISVGKEIPHPNTTEHHIRWIEVCFLPLNEKFPYQLARCEFDSHGESVQGPNNSTVYTQPVITLSFATQKSGTLIALSYCNIHGLWESSLVLNVE